jgi:hypothetical protein
LLYLEKNALWNIIFVLGKNCPFMINNKNLDKRINNPGSTRHNIIKNNILYSVYNYKHKFIIAINFFLLLAVLIFIMNKLPFKWYKVPTMLLEKVSIHTEFINFPVCCLTCVSSIILWCKKLIFTVSCSKSEATLMQIIVSYFNTYEFRIFVFCLLVCLFVYCLFIFVLFFYMQHAFWLFIAVISIRQTSEKQLPIYN